MIDIEVLIKEWTDPLGSRTVKNAEELLDCLIPAWREQQERIAELEHKEQHYLMMLEESGIDSSAAKQAECVFEQRIAELESALKGMSNWSVDAAGEVGLFKRQLDAALALCERFSALIPGAEHNPEAMAAIRELKRIREEKSDDV